MKNFIQEGDTIDFTTSGAVTSGQLVQFGNLHGVATTAAAGSGEVIALALEGVYTLPKLTGAAADACTAGGPVYFSSGSVSGSDSSGTRKLVGHSLAAAAQAATTVRVRLFN
jgi:predicted RecA/RadA family phage recombinase